MRAMIPFREIIKNLKIAITVSPLFLQLFYSLKVLWWGIGGFCGVRFIVGHLNYLVEFPWNIVLICMGIIGLLSGLLRKQNFNILFAIANVFLFALAFLTFLTHPPEYISISAGNYGIDLIGAIWLLFRIRKNHDT